MLYVKPTERYFVFSLIKPIMRPYVYMRHSQVELTLNQATYDNDLKFKIN